MFSSKFIADIKAAYPESKEMHKLGLTVYHCDELMGILMNWEKEGQKWGIDGVEVEREQQIQGRWTPVAITKTV